MCDLMVTFVFHLFSFLFVAVPTPPSLYTKVVNSSVIQAMWEPSSKMGQHQGFRLYYRRAHTPLFTGPFTFPRNVTQYNITQLGETCFLVIEQIVCINSILSVIFFLDTVIWAWKQASRTSFVCSSFIIWTSLSVLSFWPDPTLVYEIKLLAYNQHGDGNSTVRFVSLREAVEKSGDYLTQQNTATHWPTSHQCIHVKCVWVTCVIFCLKIQLEVSLTPPWRILLI